MPENDQAWAFFQEVCFWAGAGFTQDNLFDVGNIADGLRVVLEFRTICLYEDEVEELYHQFKTIVAAVNKTNVELAEKHGNKT